MNNLPVDDEYSFLKLGDKIPEFSWKYNNEESLSSPIPERKFTLIVLFATDCNHCRDNFIYLEKNLFVKKLSNINIFAYGRDCGTLELESFANNHDLTIKLLPDPDREVYSKFATKAVPRNYLFNQDGELLLSVRGYRTKDLDELIRLVS